MKLSPSRIVKFLFPDVYADIPEFVLKKAADFGSQLHKCFEWYIQDEEMNKDLINEILKQDIKQANIFEAFKKWYQQEQIKDPETEYYLDTKNIHGFIDLISFKEAKFWDYKCRNVDNKLDILKDIIQLKIYENMLYEKFDKLFFWELIIFDKKTAKIYKFSRQELGGILDKKLDILIDKTIQFLIEKEEIELDPINKDRLIKWEEK